MRRLAVVVPFFNEEKRITPLLEGFLSFRERFLQRGVCPFLVGVDDGSRDRSWLLFKEGLRERGVPAVALRLLRNFGKEAALSTALREVEADLYVFLDADLQTPLEMVFPLLEALDREGVEVAAAVKEREPYGLLRRLGTRSFFKLLELFGVKELEEGASDFLLITRRVRDRFLELPEKQFVFRSLIRWLGFPETRIPFSPGRVEGSRFSYSKLFHLGIRTLVTFSHVLRVNFFLAVFYWTISLIYAGVILYNKITHRIVTGLASTLLLMLLSFGLLFFMIALLGEVVTILFEEVKNRPLSLIAERESHKMEGLGS